MAGMVSDDRQRSATADGRRGLVAVGSSQLHGGGDGRSQPVVVVVTGDRQ